MKTPERRAAVAAYKDRKTPIGVCAVRCVADGRVWVLESRHLDTQQNSLWFSLRQGRCPSRPDLARAWAEHGEAAFRFEVLEALPDDISPLLMRSALTSLARTWRQKLGAVG